jgi:hypothetical protein
MAHRKREAFIPDLLAKLDRPATVVWDRHGNRWDTGRRSMLAYDRTATHHLVLQDDAVIPRDLAGGIEQALQHVPEGSPLCLYCGRNQPYRDTIQRLVEAAGPGTSWLTMSQLHWGVGIVMPVEHIPEMVAWCDHRSEIPNYDRRISRWCQHRGLTVYYPWPSLVDHRNSPSLVPGRGSAGRRAHRFIGAGASALGRAWNGNVVGIPGASTNTGFDGHRTWRVIGACAQASIATDNGTIRARQFFFRGSILPADVPVADLRHLWSVGLIEPVPQPAPVEAT